MHLGGVARSRSSPTSAPGPTPSYDAQWASPCRRPSAASRRCRRPGPKLQFSNTGEVLQRGRPLVQPDQHLHLGRGHPARRPGGQPLRGPQRHGRRRQALHATARTRSPRSSAPWPTRPSRRSWRRKCRSCSWSPSAWSGTTMGFGKYRGGMGYEMIVATEGHRTVGLHDSDVGRQVLLRPRHVRRLRLRHLPACQGQGRQRLRRHPRGPQQVRPVHREGHERAAVRGRPVHRRTTWACSSTSPRTASCT